MAGKEKKVRSKGEPNTKEKKEEQRQEQKQEQEKL